MEAIELQAEELNLPEQLAKKLKGKRVQLFEIEEGVLIKTINSHTENLRGFLRGSSFKTASCQGDKQVEKGLEK